MSDTGRYDLRAVKHELDRVTDLRESDQPAAIYHLARAIAKVTDYLRAKERGDV